MKLGAIAALAAVLAIGGCSSDQDDSDTTAATLPVAVDAEDVAGADLVVGATSDTRGQLVAALFGEALASVSGSTSASDPASGLAVVYVDAVGGDICDETSVVSFEASPTDELWPTCGDGSTPPPVPADQVRVAVSDRGLKGFAAARLDGVDWLPVARLAAIGADDEASEAVIDAVAERLAEMADDQAILAVDRGTAPLEQARRELAAYDLI